MSFHKWALFLWLLSCLLTSCVKNAALPVSAQTSKPEATVSLVSSQSPTQGMPPSQIANIISISPDSLYVIACQFPELVLFDGKSGVKISDLNLGFSACQRNIRWSPDSLYAILIDQQGTIYHWRVDGSQPVELNTNIDIKPSRLTGHTKITTAWSQDGKYLAIIKECNIYITQPFGGTLLQNPLKVGEGCVVGIQWATDNVLMVDIWSEYRFYQIPTGTHIGDWSKIEGCIEQIPSISPDEHWMIFHQCDTAPHFNQAPNDQYTIANLEQGSFRVFSGMAGNYIDFIGWKDDGAAFYFISRSGFPDSVPDPRTPFGLLALDPTTGEITNLFEQAWFAAFNKDLSRAFVVFPAANADGTLRLDGGLWQVGTSEIKSRQIMDSSESIRINGNRDFMFYGHFALLPPNDALISATGEYLGGGGSFHRLVPAAWSNDNTRIATINADRQVVVIDLEGSVQIIGKLDNNAPGIYGDLAWSRDDKFVIQGEKMFPVP
jgi:WD40 repeat protein